MKIVCSEDEKGIAEKKTQLYSCRINILFSVFTRMHKQVICAGGFTNNQHDRLNQN